MTEFIKYQTPSGNSIIREVTEDGCHIHKILDNGEYRLCKVDEWDEAVRFEDSLLELNNG